MVPVFTGTMLIKTFIMKQRILQIIFMMLIACCFILTGCAQVYSNFYIEKVDVPESNPGPAKFYIVSISGTFVKQENVPEIKKQLLQKYPNFFSEDKENSIRVNFYWNCNYNQGNIGQALLSGITFGIIPCISTNEHNGNLSARFPRMGHFMSSRGKTYNSVSYSITENRILHMPNLAILTAPIAGAILSACSDLSSPYYASIQESLETPFQVCDANLRLFPLACAKLYNSLSSEEKQAVKDRYAPEEIKLLTK